MLRRLRLLSIGHSYVVGLNRRLPQGMAQVGADRWDVTVAAPRFFAAHRDIRDHSLQPSEHEPTPLVPLNTYNTRQVQTFWYGWKIRELLSQSWDVVHAWEEPYILAGAQIAYLCPRNSRFVFRTAQSLNKIYPPPFSMLEEYSVWRCNGWICSGQTVQENLLPRPGYARRPHALLPLGVDLASFRPNPAARQTIRQQLGWGDDSIPIIGYFGRFVPEKGLPMLLQVLDSLKTPWRAIFVGGGPMTEVLRAWERHWPNQLRVLTDVRHDDMPDYLNSADLMVLPSQTTRRWREQFGRIIVEAFACGVPVIGSDSGEIPYVIGSAGRVCPERDPSAWVEAITELLNDPHQLQQYAAAGLERCRRYEWSVIARDTLDFFERLQ